MPNTAFCRLVLVATVLAFALPLTTSAQAGFHVGPDLSILETAPASVTAGQMVTFTVNVFNAGTTPVADASFHFSLPHNVSLEPTPVMPFGPWSCGGYWYGGLSYGNFGCFYHGAAVPPGGTFPSWYVTVQAATSGPFHVCSDVSIPVGPHDVNHINDQSCINGTVQPKPKSDLSVSVTGPGSVVSGLGANFAITVHNGGPSPVNAQSGITVTDMLPTSAVTGPVITVALGWNCTTAGLTVNCSYTGGAVSSGSNLPQIIIRTKAGVTGSHHNCATVAMTAGDDTVPGNNHGCVDFEVRLAQTGNSHM
ncbi:MAG: hypothetical protein GC166_05185 [Alphaproteobacteria bacterium]|nr:hypothetical protein [Alphaproteobacteria bacterium]